MSPKLILALLAVLLSGCGPADYLYPATSLKGEYRAVRPPPQTLAVVQVEQIINFSCKHCYQAWKELEQLALRAHGRLEIVTLPIVFANGSEHATRLFHVAKRERGERQAIAAIFAAAFDEGKDLRNESSVIEVAEKLLLRELYIREKGASWVNAAIARDRARAARYDLSRTPSWVIAEQWIVKPDAANMWLIINNLLQLESPRG